MSQPIQLGSLLLVGVNHNTAPLDVRERLAIPPARLADAMRSLACRPGVREALILSTCNRVELLTVTETQDGAGSATAVDFLHEYLELPIDAVTPHVYTLREREAVHHLFRVASSLDSMVLGEPQILGQVKESWNIAREVGAIRSAETTSSTAAFSSTGALSSMLDPLLQRAFFVAKRVRSETQIGSSTVSIASVAAELARKIFGSLANKTILLVGAGKMSDLAAKHLIQQGATTLLVSNRTEARAEKIADLLRTPDITTGVIPFSQLHEQTHRADIIITSTGASQIFTPEQARALVHRRRNRPVFFIDIAVPRDVDPAVNEIEGCFVYDIDDLQQVAHENRTLRGREAETAESIVQMEAERYGERLAQAPATEAIKQLQSAAERIREAELARTAQRLASLGAGLTPEQQSAIEHLTRALTNKLLHRQIVALRGGEFKRRGEDES